MQSAKRVQHTPPPVQIPIEIPQSIAKKFRDWILTRGGILVWRSIDITNPDGTWYTPKNNAMQTATLERPHPHACPVPSAHITNSDMVMVRIEELVGHRVCHLLPRKEDLFNMQPTIKSMGAIRNTIQKYLKKYPSVRWELSWDEKHRPCTYYYAVTGKTTLTQYYPDSFSNHCLSCMGRGKKTYKRPNTHVYTDVICKTCGGSGKRPQYPPFRRHRHAANSSNSDRQGDQES